MGHATIGRNYCWGWGVTVVVEVVSFFTAGGGAVVVVVTSVTGAGWLWWSWCRSPAAEAWLWSSSNRSASPPGRLA